MLDLRLGSQGARKSMLDFRLAGKALSKSMLDLRLDGHEVVTFNSNLVVGLIEDFLAWETILEAKLGRGDDKLLKISQLSASKLVERSWSKFSSDWTPCLRIRLGNGKR